MRFNNSIILLKTNFKIYRHFSSNEIFFDVSAIAATKPDWKENFLKNVSEDLTEITPAIAPTKPDWKENCLKNVSEDLTDITPHFSNAFNLAAYVNKSDLLQKFVQLEVNLSKIEKKSYIAEKLLKLDFEKNVKKHIFFLKEYVEEANIGKFITKNPMILCEPLDDLEVRVNYLQSKHFSSSQIKRVISVNPFWLMFSTQRIDKRLGFYQQQFDLNGNDVRYLAAKQPKLITYNLHHIKTNTFAIKEEFGFSNNEVKKLIMDKPKIWMIGHKHLLQRFNFIHNVMKIPHSLLLQYPEVLLCRDFKIKQRHLFLERLGRAQYDPNKENYVPLIGLVKNPDSEFCKKYAKCTVSDYNIFLKTL